MLVRYGKKLVRLQIMNSSYTLSVRSTILTNWNQIGTAKWVQIYLTVIHIYSPHRYGYFVSTCSVKSVLLISSLI